MQRRNSRYFALFHRILLFFGANYVTAVVEVEPILRNKNVAQRF